MIYVPDYDFCCSVLFVRGFGDLLNSYSDSFGTYYRSGKYNDKAAYKLVDKEFYLFKSRNTYIEADDEVWMVI